MTDLYTIVVPEIKDHWEKVAYYLDFKPADVKRIQQKNNDDIIKCGEQLFEDLLEADHESPITWDTILKAIESVQELTAARKEIVAKINEH